MCSVTSNAHRDFTSTDKLMRGSAPWYVFTCDLSYMCIKVNCVGGTFTLHFPTRGEAPHRPASAAFLAKSLLVAGRQDRPSALLAGTAPSTRLGAPGVKAAHKKQPEVWTAPRVRRRRCGRHGQRWGVCGSQTACEHHCSTRNQAGSLATRCPRGLAGAWCCARW